MSIISKTNVYVFTATLVFLLLLWFFNPGNYIVAGSFIALIFIYYYKLRNFRLSLLFAFLTSTIVFTGKSYPILLIPKGVLPTEIYPFGYFVRFTISPEHILASAMALIMFRDLVNRRVKNIKLKIYDYLLIAYFLWSIISDYIGSSVPTFSLLFSLSGLTALILYFYIKIYATNRKRFIKTFVYLLSAILIFEFLASSQQFLAKSPLGKTLEAQWEIEYFGHAADEIQFTFRSLGTFPHANALGIWISSYLIIITLIFLTKPGFISGASILTGVTTLVLTLSRSSWLGYFTGILTALFIMEKVRGMGISKNIKKYLPWFFLLGIPLFIFIIFPRIEKSAFTFTQGGGYFREVQFKRALDLIIKHPVFGVGSERSVPEGLKLVNPKDPNFSILANIHNQYLLNATEHGLPLILLFALLMYVYFKNVLRSKKFSLYTLGLATGVLSTLIAGFFQPFINFQIIIIALAFL